MNPYLRASLICFALCGLILYLVYGCATYTAMGESSQAATYAISVVGEKHPVRVAWGFWGLRESLIAYAQAQVWMYGQWQWLCVNFPAVYTCPRDPEFDPQQYYVPSAWFQDYVLPRMVVENQ
jgi:hypothetical protein